MDINQLHFSHPLWLWTGITIPLVWIAYFFFYRLDRPTHQLEKFIDKHLLPYLFINKSHTKDSFWKHLLLWTIAWSFLTLALAGPSWSFREEEMFSKDQSLVILLDLSESMNASDVKPSRLVRAKQKIEDLINLSQGVKIGLVAFAADPHMITPITDDKEMIRHLLPSLNTDLIFVQGSRLTSALDMAYTMLNAEPGTNKAILVISDGGFEDSNAMITAKRIAEKGIVIHAMGVGTVEGTPIRDHEGNVIKRNGAPLLSKLEDKRFSEISKIGKGYYLEAHYSSHDEDVILKELEKRAEAQMALGKKQQIWDEHFYLFLLPVMPLLLWWFRRGYVFALILLCFLPTFDLRADAIKYFKNSEQLGKEALEEGDYEGAANRFQDPYRKGVSFYKAGKFSEAEEMFRQSSRADIACNAAYNRGNSLVHQQKLKEAVKVYETLLEEWPNCIKARENLELVKKMLEQQQKADDSEDSDENQEKDNEENQPNQNDSSDKQEEPRDNEDKSNDKQSNEGQESPKEMDDEQEVQSKDNGTNEEGQKQQKRMEEEKESPGNVCDAKTSKSEEDQNADLWLNRITNDPETFLKNKFYVESKKNGTSEGINPW